MEHSNSKRPDADDSDRDTPRDPGHLDGVRSQGQTGDRQQQQGMHQGQGSQSDQGGSDPDADTPNGQEGSDGRRASPSGATDGDTGVPDDSGGGLPRQGGQQPSDDMASGDKVSHAMDEGDNIPTGEPGNGSTPGTDKGSHEGPADATRESPTRSL